MNKKEIEELFDLSASIDAKTADLQSKACMRIIEMLEDLPGIILGDDVGMGKTYIAFSTAVWYLHKNPKKQVVIITPSWLLNEKWFNDIRNFIEKNLHFDKVKLRESDIKMIYQYDHGTYIEQIAEASKNGKVLLIPINVFATIGWKHEKSFFLACWFKHKRFWGKTREEILSAMDGDISVYAPEDFSDMGITYQDIPEEWYTALNEAYSLEGLSSLGVNKIWDEIKNLRYKVINKVMPEASLLILDEAHKMKNEGTVKRKGLEAAVYRKFYKGIFLTATPFQLGEGELRSVLDMFKAAIITQSQEDKFEQLISSMFLEMTKYQELMSIFENYVHAMSPDEAILLENAIERDSCEKLSYDVSETYSIYQKLLQQKSALELTMKKLIVRNVKRKDMYRKEIIGSMDNESTQGLPLSSEAYIPFALMEKAIYQILAQGDRTFIANIKQSFTSSFDAVLNSSVMEREIEAIQMIEKLKIGKIAHPKLTKVSEKVVDLLMDGQKTLLFCDRLDTMKQMKSTLEKRIDRKYDRDIKKLYPDNGEKGFNNFCKRFYNKMDVSWFLLQESFIHSVLIPILNICGKNKKSIPSASDIVEEVNSMYSKYNNTNKANYMYIKRIVEQIVFRKTLAGIEGWQKQLKLHRELLNTAYNIMDSRYIQFGLNLEENANEEQPNEEDERTIKNISNKLITNVMKHKGIWEIYKEKLNKLPPVERDELVTSMILFLRRDRRFFIHLHKIKDKYPSKENDFLIKKTFSAGSLLDWENAYQRFLDRYCDETTANREEMRLGLNNKEVVAIINRETTNEARSRIKAGFNTPFYPQILIATKTMQEGIDLQKECKEIIHYDMEWNPASMEQRVGRIDRIGSLISSLREKDESATLDIYYPYIKNTIDESIYNTVKDREKWFNLILGGTPQWDTFEIDPDVTNIKSWVFKRLQIDLSVE